jgi:hypothetical protein
MIDDYVNKLIENLPEESKKLQRLDLVLDGGIFNGSYLIGALYFLREMERRNYVKIERISGCSIGSVVAFLFFIDSLDLIPKLYDILKNDFKNNMTLNTIKKLKSYLEDRIPNDICSKVNGKLFICYNDIKKRKKCVKSKYKSAEEIIDTIIKSCFIPLLIDNKLLYKKKYIDGINAYIFDKEPNKKILHMELFGYDKIINSLHIKNEKTNFHRILAGLLDIHSFYIKKKSTSMCSFVSEWTKINTFNYQIKVLFEYLIVYIIFIINYIVTYLPDEISSNILFKILSKISFDTFSIIMETYFL